MTSVSLINPYAPQPVGNASWASNHVTAQTLLPLASTEASAGTGFASDQSGHGAGNGTGTGGAQLAVLMQRERSETAVPRPTPESIVNAQSGSDPASQFLERQAMRQAKAEAAEQARIAQQAEVRAQAARAALPQVEMPNPLPTAPILKRDET
jgi:hypothetical protein